MQPDPKQVPEKAAEAVREAVEAGVPEDVFHQMCERFMWAATTGPHHADATAEKAVLEIVKPLLGQRGGDAVAGSRKGDSAPAVMTQRGAGESGSPLTSELEAVIVGVLTDAFSAKGTVEEGRMRFAHTWAESIVDALEATGLLPTQPSPESGSEEALIDHVLERFRPTRAVFDMEGGATQEVDWRSVVGNILYYADRIQPESGSGEEGERPEEGVCPECDHDIRPHAWHARDCSRHPSNRPTQPLQGSEVERFAHTPQRMFPVGNRDWVWFTDYTALQAQLQRVEGERDQLAAWNRENKREAGKAWNRTHQAEARIQEAVEKFERRARIEGEVRDRLTDEHRALDFGQEPGSPPGEAGLAAARSFVYAETARILRSQSSSEGGPRCKDCDKPVPDESKKRGWFFSVRETGTWICPDCKQEEECEHADQPHTVWWSNRAESGTGGPPACASASFHHQTDALDAAKKLVDNPEITWVKVFRSDNESYTCWRWNRDEADAASPSPKENPDA